MRRFALSPALLLALSCAPLVGCAAPIGAHPDTTLGRVVVYKSGVAYFERYASIDDDVLRLSVPPAQLDDFLKSLTVVDESTGAAAPIAFPHATTGQSGLVELEIQLRGPRPHKLKLSYVTEAPSWKPTYRIALAAGGKVAFEGWAIVDNASSEDWKRVKLGVGSSSALSFRFDLQSTRSIARIELTPSDRFAIAPPTGDSPYGAESADGQSLVGELADVAVAPPAGDASRDAPDVAVARMENQEARVGQQVAAARVQKDMVKVLCLTDKATQLETIVRAARERRRSIEGTADPALAAHDRAALGVLKERGDRLVAESQQCIGQEISFVGDSRVAMQVDPNLPPEDGESITQWAKRREAAAPANPPPALGPPPPPARVVASDVRAIAERLRARPGHVLIEGYSRPNDPDPRAAALERASAARTQLLQQGIAADRLRVVVRGPAAGNALVRFVRVSALLAGPQGGATPGDAAARALAEPIGASHFEAAAPLTIAHGASAMISVVKAETEGEVVYLYDAESARGNAMFPFRAVRLVNPTDSTLESGPVTVFGEGRFVGEGLCEPIPAKSAGFIPFALDRQVIADGRTSETDGAPRLVAMENEALTTEVLRTRRTRVTLHNRLQESTTVFVRHSVPPGYELQRAPADRERAGGAYLFKVSVPAAGKAEVFIEEATSIVTTTDLWSPEGFDAVRAYVATATAGPVRDGLLSMVKLAEEAGSLRQKAAATRALLDDERRRADRLRGQIASLRGGRTSAPLLAPLDRKLEELDRRLSHATLELLGLDERLAVLHVRAADAAHDLRLDGKGRAAPR